jgi:predicted nucleotidyltransferase
VLGLIQQRLPYCTATAFGSRVSEWPARGVRKKHSDLDIALWGLQPADDLALAHLRADFEDSALPWRVDLSDAQDLPDALRDLVLRHGIPLTGQAKHQTLAA